MKNSLAAIDCVCVYFMPPACHGVVDVSALGRVHKLVLESCSNVEDVGALGGCHTLNLGSCCKVTVDRSHAQLTL